MSNTPTEETNPPKPKVLKQIFARGNNRRMQISMVQDSEGPPYFLIQVRMLYNRKQRIINRHTLIITGETFAVLGDLYQSFLHDVAVVKECNTQMQNPLYKVYYRNIQPHDAHAFINDKP